MKQAIILTGFLFPLLLSAQVKGRVVNNNDDGIPFASIQVKNTTNGTTTDSAGYFSLSGISKFPITLLVSFAGFEPEQKIVRADRADNVIIRLQSLFQKDTIVITSRRRKERLQDVPIPVTVVSGAQVDNAGAFNINRVKELTPSVQLYSSNPRNTGINIRGLGSPFGLTNDGLDPGVGLYIDGVYIARPAAATFDFIDIDQIEILRGPQGTLFGKNTTAGAFNITTRKPSFKPGGTFELGYGNYGFIQAKSSVTGPLGKKIAARFSFSGTQRDGTVYNKRTDRYINDINNLGVKGQFLFKASEKTSILVSGDYSRQRPDGYAQVVAGVAPTKRAGYRQFDSIITSLKYQLPSRDAFDRVVDHDTPWKSATDLGGVSINLDSKIGPGTFTSTTAYRYWNWDPSNDRDFTGLQALAKSQNPSKHKNWSEEIRYAGDLSSKVSGVIGLFVLGQDVNTHGTEESGSAQWRFSQSSTSGLWKTPGLFEGYGIYTVSSIKSLSAAAFANIDWQIAQGFHIQPGLRFNYDKKEVKYDRVAYGGLQTSDPALLALKNGVYSSQHYDTDADENNLTYNITLSYKPTKRINAFATYSTAFKPVGVNVAGLPTVNGEAATDLAVIKPEDVKQVEFGIKTNLTDNFIFNINFYNTDIKDYQTNVQSPELGVNRGYIANAEKVRVRGAELDASLRAGKHFTFSAAATYTDAKYVTFTNAPLPLEETGYAVNGQQVAFKDISGGDLPGISKWSGSLGTEFTTPAALFGNAGKFFIAVDAFYRSSFSSSPSPSSYLNVDGYTLVNARTGFRTPNGFSVFIWSRNLFNKDYHEQLLVAGGNAGQYASVLGDPLTYGITLRHTF